MKYGTREDSKLKRPEERPKIKRNFAEKFIRFLPAIALLPPHPHPHHA